MQKRWKILPTFPKETRLLQQQLGVNAIICSILVQRGITSYEEAQHFFRPSEDHFHDPFLMKDMQKAVDRIVAAIRHQEKILVYGDYDVDGTASVAGMFRFLQGLHTQIEFYIPHRYKEGYGISQEGIAYAQDHNCTLIVALDCGIKSVELIQQALEKGIDFIICDHHQPGPELPPAYAILNPRQQDCPYPYKELCGCGVGFKLMQGLSAELQLPADHYLKYLDLVATAIAADIVPLTGENRTLAFFGLQQINTTPSAGIKALLQTGGVTSEIRLGNLVFVVAPRINAAGRMNDARKAVELFIEKDLPKAIEIAEQLHSDNSDRKEADLSITKEALEIIGADEQLIKRKTTVLFKDHWHKGVVGIVASRLIDLHYYRPTIILTQSGDIVAGSARSVAGFNLYEAIHACREHLIGYGGHFAAAGMTLLPEQVEAFANKFEEVVTASITEASLVPEIIIDAEIKFSDLTPTFYQIITEMEPFGPGNMRPVFVSKYVKDTGASKVVKEQHIRFIVRQGAITLSGIGFNMAARFPLLQSNHPVDIVYTLDMNEWNGGKYLQMKVLDFRLSEQ